MDPWLSGLNPDQSRAVTSRAKHLLVLAGAGSGKTYVITRRILHLIDTRLAEPGQILAITFTRNAAREMAQRLSQELAAGTTAPGFQSTRKSIPGAQAASRLANLGVSVRTFHSLCYLILRRHWRLIFERPFNLVTESPVSGQEPEFAEKSLNTKSELMLEAARKCFKDPDFRIAFKRYLWNYLLIPDETDRYGSGFDLRRRRIVTLSGLQVRSYAERDIANWLSECKVPFLYDHQAAWSSPPFRADFYLPGLEIYLEVWEFENRRKAEQRSAKLEQYMAHGKRLIEVGREEVLNFPALEKRLIEALPEVFPGGVPGKSLSGDLDSLESSETGYPEAIKSFLALAEETLDKVKNHSVDRVALDERARREKHLRTRSFFALFLPVYDQYQKLLKKKGAVDFNDLILQTVELLRQNPQLRERYRKRWRQILVDEYQDVNTPQVLLLKELVGPENGLTCVGDDWQSIYGFRGSNVGHILHFEADFPEPEVVPLRVNYRSGRSIVEFAGYAIGKCRQYHDKPLVALKRDVQRIILYRAGRLYEDGVAYVVARVRELIEHGGHQPGEILVLYRRSASYRMLGEALRQAGLRVRHETIHGAKGLEARTVFLWALTGGRGGFPSIREEGRIMKLLLPVDIQGRLDEERRIFYVALTRALERLFLITEKNNASQFLEPLPLDYFEPSVSLELKTAAVLTAPRNCSACGGSILPEYRFCPLCFYGIKDIRPRQAKKPPAGGNFPDHISEA